MEDEPCSRLLGQIVRRFRPHVKNQIEKTKVADKTMALPENLVVRLIAILCWHLLFCAQIKLVCWNNFVGCGKFKGFADF